MLFLPLLATQLRFIQFSSNTDNLPKFAEAVCAIDCAHPRLRPHPHRFRFYNGAKRCHCLYVQTLCGLNGEIFDVFIAEGKNNDRGLLMKSCVNDQLRSRGMKALGDRGYNITYTIVAPKDNPNMYLLLITSITSTITSELS